MKKATLLLVMIVFLIPNLSKSQAVNFFDNEFEEYSFLYQDEIFTNNCLENDLKKLEKSQACTNLDTMSIYSLLCYWQKNKNCHDIEFAISKTSHCSLFNYGIFWPNGKVIILPKKQSEIILDCFNDNLALIWINAQKGEVKMHFSYLQKLKINDSNLPRMINIEVL